MIETTYTHEQIAFARRELGRYKEAQSDIKHHANSIKHLQERARRVNRPLDPNRVNVQSSANTGPEDLLCTIADLQMEHRRMQKEAEETCFEIALKIGELESKLYQRILRGYWLYNQSLEKLAVSENYSYRGIKNKHRDALLSYAEKFAPDCPLT